MKIKGFTLIEVIIATSIISVVFTTLASIVAVSLRTTSANSKRIIGTHMADGLQEWVRGERDNDWETFKTSVGTWCNHDEIISGWGNKINDENDPACAYLPGTNNFPYKRIVKISAEGEVFRSRIDFIWQEGTTTNRVTNEAFYSQW